MKKRGLISIVFTILLGTVCVPVQAKHNKHEIRRALGVQNIIPVAILGSGPAGFTAGLYAARAKVRTVIFTGDLLGGQLTNTTYVENWPGVEKKYGYEIMQTVQQQAQEAGALVVEEAIGQVNFSQWPFELITVSGTTVHALAVIIAMGAAPRRLGIAGELEYWGRGVTPCAVCDCVFFKNKDVVIVGGGDAAIEEAIQLASYAKTVTILVRKDRMRAVECLQDKLAEYSNITVLYNKQILAILGDGEQVTGVQIKNVLTDTQETLSVQGVFLAIGHNPNTELFAGQVAVNSEGYIELSSRSQMTSVEGIYAAGDVEDAEFRQAVVASAHGCQASLEAIKRLRALGLTDVIARKLEPYYYT